MSVTLVFISNLRINPIYVYKCSVFSVPCIFCSVSVSALHTRSCVTDFQRSFSEECFSLPFPPLSLSLSLLSFLSFLICVVFLGEYHQISSIINQCSINRNRRTETEREEKSRECCLPEGHGGCSSAAAARHAFLHHVKQSSLR